MKIYRAEGIESYIKYAEAISAEHTAAHELAECCKVEVYSLLAVDLFTRVKQARQATAEAYENLSRFEDQLPNEESAWN